jgi:glutamate-5-semialdehyde dehydrogenase
MAQAARQAARTLAVTDRAHKDRALLILADMLTAHTAEILSANAEDIQLAEQAGLAPALIDRLETVRTSLLAIAADVRKVAELPDPVGIRFDQTCCPMGCRYTNSACRLAYWR